MFFHVLPMSKRENGAKATRLPSRGKDPLTGEIVSSGAVGFDIYAPEPGRLDTLEGRLIPLGFAASFPEGYIGKMFDRSGMGNKGITLLAGVMDPDYRNEWGVILYNTKPTPFKWDTGDRICQVVFWKVEVDFEPAWVTELEKTVRNLGGIGSSGK